MSVRNYGLVTSVEELAELFDRIHGNPFGFDIETGYHGPDIEKGAVRVETALIAGFSFTDSTDWARYVPLAHNEGYNLDSYVVAQLLWDLLWTGQGVAHNAVFELRHLAKFFRQQLWDDPLRGSAVQAQRGYFPIRSDTMIEAYLAADFERFGLKPLTLAMFDRHGQPVDPGLYRQRTAEIAGLNKIKDKAEKKQALADYNGHVMTELLELFPDLPKNRTKMLRFNTLPLTSEVVDYGCEDSVWCLAIHQHYHGQVSPRLLFTVEKAIVESVVPAMEDAGIQYDWTRMRRTADELRAFRDKFNAEIMDDLTALTGEPIAINLGSPLQVRRVLFEQLSFRTTVYTDKTRDLPPDQRVMSTGDIALTKLAQHQPVVKKILQWREQTKLLGTYLDKYETKFRAEDGRAHPNHLSAFVITGRFAVSDPPYQGCIEGHQCVLTPSGWQRLDKLDDQTPVAQYHPDGTLSFVVPEVVRNVYPGDLLEFESRETGTWAYTPDHRIVYRTRKPRGDRGLTEIKECRADEWAARLNAKPQGPLGARMHDWRIPRAGTRRGGRILDENARRALRLAVACQADGCLNWKAYDVRVFRDRKIAALREMNIAFTTRTRTTTLDGKTYTGLEYSARVPMTEVDEWLDDTVEKNFRPEAILALCADDLRWFVHEVMQWDGDSTRGCTYSQDERRRSSVDTVQAAAALCGYTTSIYERPDKHMVTVNIWDRDHKDPGWQKVRSVPSDGMVYCVTVPTGMFLCRNDQGKVMVTGNSPKKYHFDLVEARAAHEAGEEPPPGTCFKFNFRDCIVAPPDHYILGFDLSQAELRAIAGEAQEQSLIDAFANGEDVHRLTASLMLGIPLDQVTDDQRSIGKTLNFAILYGMGVKSLSDRLGIEIDEAQSLMDKYFAGFPAIAAWSAKQIQLGKSQGYVTSKFGRKLPIWEYQSDKRWIYQKGDRACVNYPIQGAATGDAMKIAMVRATAAIKKAGYAGRMQLVMNVHDALEFYVHKDITPEQAIAVLKEAVVFPIPGWPDMQADWHIAKRWGSPIEVSVNDDGSLTVKGEKVYELAPAIEVDEETGEVVEVLPELAPETVRQALAAGGQHLVLSLKDMPTAHAWDQFKLLIAEHPGPHHLRVQTPQGDVTVQRTVGLSSANIGQLSALFPGAILSVDRPDVDADEVMAGLSL